MKHKQPSIMDIILNVVSKAVFVFLVLYGFMLYVEYEWMMK